MLTYLRNFLSCHPLMLFSCLIVMHYNAGIVFASINIFASNPSMWLGSSGMTSGLIAPNSNTNADIMANLNSNNNNNNNNNNMNSNNNNINNLVQSHNPHTQSSHNNGVTTLIHSDNVGGSGGGSSTGSSGTGGGGSGYSGGSGGGVGIGIGSVSATISNNTSKSSNIVSGVSGNGGKSATNADYKKTANNDTTAIGGGGGGGPMLISAGSSSISSTASMAALSKEKCSGPGDPGDCNQYTYKWRYEPTTNECLSFIWSGCGGNSLNRFNSEAECLFHCIGVPHTLPPFLQTTTYEPPSTTDSLLGLVPHITLDYNGANSHYGGLDSNPIPFEQRGPELTFAETGHEKTFVFAQNNTFIQIDGDIIQTFQLRLCREISFQFRTRLPHGLLVYHNVKNPDRINLNPYALYVIVEKGQLKVVHVFGKHSISVTVGEGLNRDEWHSVMVRIDVHGARLIARVDTHQEEVYLKGLNHDTNYGVSTNLPSVVLVGGLSSEEKLHGVKYIIESFVGCIRNVTLSAGKAASDLLPITPLIATKHENVNEGCSNKCYSRHNLCFVGSTCVNHYSGVSCDCFGTYYEGDHCDIYTATIITLRGSSYVSYRIYDWKDRVHASTTRISLMFRTQFDDSALFYASGETFKHQYIAAAIKNQSIYVEMDFGDHVMATTLTDELTRNYWHNLTIYHEQHTVRIILDEQMKLLEIPSSTTNINLLFDPEIYFGGGPDLHKKKGLASHNNFVGSFKYVYYNDVSILYELQRANPKVHYHGILQAEFQENDVNVIPITYPFATSHIWWPINHVEKFNIKFDFRSSRTAAILAYSEVTTQAGKGFWEIRLASDKLNFDLVPDTLNNVTLSTSVKINRATSWHSVELDYKHNEIKFIVDYQHYRNHMYGLKFNIGDKLIIGSSLKAATSGLIGCIRDIEINGLLIEPRHVVKTERVVGEVALDNCQYIDPCKRPNTCEHGGKCFVKDDRVTCDCKHTGYIGKNCHFTKYRKTCEELALLGYTKSDVYLIDIDGNGVFPPAHVKCDFQSLENATKTIVEHNLPSQVDVRSTHDTDFSFTIRYREFSPEMLQELISHSLYCTQYIKYDCYKAQLELHSATWFTSSAKNYTVDFLGNVKRGSCPCSVNKTCADPNQSCNCDVVESKWHSDEGYYTEPISLGITHMYFLQQKDLDDEAQGRITLGPLECVETNTQKYVVTFTTSQSYIEVPGWRKGDIAFSFRTTGEKAILLFQPPIRPYHPSFMVALTGDYQLTFNFTLSTGTARELVINSHRKLNGGEWHKIWIDYNEYHVRFMINTDYQMVDLLQEEKFGPFEGSMYIGGATADLLKKLSVKTGLIGCFRGLVVNGEILDIYSYMSVHLSEIIKDCKPSCVPNPCKNGAVCKELWSSFKCLCNNTWAHLGEFCEININEKALTFINRHSFLMRNYLSANAASQPSILQKLLDDERNMLKGILYQNILINLRIYATNSLVLYANDHFNNFVHLFISDSHEIIFLYNYGDEIVNLTIVDESASTLKSIQVAIIREEHLTYMHVNEQKISIDRGTLLLDEYANKPWINPEKEVLLPHRPPAPPTEYFQINIGGYDPVNLLRPNSISQALDGYVGCVRGLKIGTNLIDLAIINERNIATVTDGVLPNCQIKCDAEPCKNNGVCRENFAKQESTCDCEHTSFMGEFCMEEKGADFSGESTLQRKFDLIGKVQYIRLHLAFSSFDLRRTNRVMLLIETIAERSYYLMIAITTEGYLLFEEDREGSTVGARIQRNFLNNARHSIYYIRNMTDSEFYIDRDIVTLKAMSTRTMSLSSTGISVNRVQIGGINTTDSRFAIFKSYSGCLSNTYVQVNHHVMKPLEEYMLFTKSGADNITVINPQGVRSAQCVAKFDITEQPSQEPMINISLSAENWVEEPPQRVPYIAKYIYDESTKEDSTQVAFIILTAMFVVIIICCLLEVYRSHLVYKKRLERETDESIIRSKEQATKLYEDVAGGQSYAYKALSMDEVYVNGGPKVTPLVGILKNNGNGIKREISETNDLTNSNGSVTKAKIHQQIEEMDEENSTIEKNRGKLLNTLNENGTSNESQMEFTNSNSDNDNNNDDNNEQTLAFGINIKNKDKDSQPETSGHLQLFENVNHNNEKLQNDHDNETDIDNSNVHDYKGTTNLEQSVQQQYQEKQTPINTIKSTEANAKGKTSVKRQVSWAEIDGEIMRKTPKSNSNLKSMENGFINATEVEKHIAEIVNKRQISEKAIQQTLLEGNYVIRMKEEINDNNKSLQNDNNDNNHFTNLLKHPYFTAISIPATTSSTLSKKSVLCVPIAPIAYLNVLYRKFASPISFLGGPFPLPGRKNSTNSMNSILSLD